MPLTLCHGGLMDTDVAKQTLGPSFIHAAQSRRRIWHLKSPLVSVVNTVAFHDSATTAEIDFIHTAS